MEGVPAAPEQTIHDLFAEQGLLTAEQGKIADSLTTNSDNIKQTFTQKLQQMAANILPHHNCECSCDQASKNFTIMTLSVISGQDRRHACADFAQQFKTRYPLSNAIVTGNMDDAFPRVLITLNADNYDAFFDLPKGPSQISRGTGVAVESALG